MGDREDEETRCTLKPPMKLLSAIEYPELRQLYLPVAHHGRVFMRTPEKKLVAMDEASGEVLWENADELIWFPELIWRDRLVGHYNKKVRVEGGAILDESVGLALIDLQTGRTERVLECDSSQQKLAGGSTLLGGSLGAVRALDFDTGKTIWTWKSEPEHYVTPSSLAADARAVYFGLDGWLVALDQRTGHEVWRSSIPEMIDNMVDLKNRYGNLVDPVVHNSAVHGEFLVCEAGFWVVGLRLKDGKRQWVWGREGYDVSGMSLYNGLCYVYLHDGHLVRLEPATGRVVSDHDLTRGLPKELRGAVPTKPFLVSDTHVFTGSRRGAVMAFERETGRYAWSLQPKGAAATGDFFGSGFVVGDKRLYYSDASLRVYCLAEDPTTHGGQAEKGPKAKRSKKLSAKARKAAPDGKVGSRGRGKGAKKKRA